ncbi:peptidase family M13 [Dictyocaulus viviparus]|uniref:Peptidase family M13 n=1 Tax=Dictyocaulus viviparus TaxID=29172 RepID=A0A0D8XX80_DICVI|nr:peptidase family M13 [Dictyocaulus viviparus]
MICFMTLLFLIKLFSPLPSPCKDENGYSSLAEYDVASEMLTKSMNLLIDPCENFYQFACAKWLLRHPVSIDQKAYSNFNTIEDKVSKQIRGILGSQEIPKSKSIRAFKTIYHKCMDESEINLNGARRFLDTVRFIPHTLGLVSHEPYLNKDKPNRLLDGYRQLIINKIKLFYNDANIPIDETKVAKDVDDIIALETKLAEIQAATVNADFTRERLSKLQKLVPLVKWSEYFHSITPFATHHYINGDPIVMINSDFITRVNDLLQSVDSKIITNYVYMYFSKSWRGELGQRYEDIQQEFEKYVFRSSTKEPRWKYCLRTVQEEMKLVSGALYETINATMEIVEDIMSSFREILHENEWINEAMKTKVLNKLKLMRRQIGYPEFILDDRMLDDYYSGLNVYESESYTQGKENLLAWSIRKSFLELINPHDKSDFTVDPALVNAFYSPQSNSIVFPAAILQEPYFHQSFPKALNYGALGSVIGHEITHAFDNKGRLYDAEGNLRDWWDGDVEKKFVERSKCFIEQYSKIEVVQGVNINGTRSLGENIADNGGVKQAFRAYAKYLKKFGNEKRLKGLEEFSNEQMFFIAYAKAFCGNLHISALINRVYHDTHTPYEYRVNQALANQPEFASAFRCSAGTPMNPAKRCVVW